MLLPALRTALPALLVLVTALACAPETPAPKPSPGGNVLPGTPGVVGRPSTLRVAWTTVGGQSAPLWVAQDAGLFKKHNLDVELVFMESGTAAVQAALAGEVPIFATSSPTIVNARLDGADVVELANYVPSADVRDEQYPFASVGSTDRFVRDQPDTVRNFMRAFVEAIHYFKTKPVESKQILRTWMKTDDEQLIDETWDAYAQRYLSSKPYPTVQGAQAMLELAAQTSTKVIVANPLEYINPKFVEELDKGGFVDTLK
jgi:ABC-type nitrate/sulfonate/bicarbonate transport system substrate-binding protein